MVNGLVDDWLLYTRPRCSKASLQIIHIMYRCLIHSILHNTLNLVIHWKIYWQHICQKLSKSAQDQQSYCKNKKGAIFWNTVYFLITCLYYPNLRIISLCKIRRRFSFCSCCITHYFTNSNLQGVPKKRTPHSCERCPLFGPLCTVHSRHRKTDRRRHIMTIAELCIAITKRLATENNKGVSKVKYDHAVFTVKSEMSQLFVWYVTYVWWQNLKGSPDLKLKLESGGFRLPLRRYISR